MYSKILFIVILFFILVNCKEKDRNNDIIESKGIYNYKITLVDSLVYNYSSDDNVMISKIGWITFRDSIILITDIEQKCIYMFDEKLKRMIKQIGRKGRAGGEYISTPIIIEGTNQLEVIEGRTKKVNV